jgi:uncharacterized protein
MTKVGILSDTHNYLDTNVLDHFSECDEIWHAGDIGDLSVLERLWNTGKKVRAVYGNIDGADLRAELEETLIFNVAGMDVLMTHIGGYPGRYNKNTQHLIAHHRPGLFVCGHSHILKIIYDKKYNLLHINPGAAGVHGFHAVRTAIRFQINYGVAENIEIIEFDKRGMPQGEI